MNLIFIDFYVPLLTPQHYLSEVMLQLSQLLKIVPAFYGT